MESNVLQKRWVQGRNVVVDDLRGTAFTGENGAHTFRVIGVDSAQETVAITGTITGRFLTATNVTVPLTGSVSDGVASLTLTEDCYVIPGRFVLSIYATNGSTTQCIYCAVGNVFRTQSDIIEYPSASIPDIEQIIADAQAAVTQINADVAAAQAAVAAAQTAVDGIEDQRQTMIASIASVAGQGTDTTLTQSGVAADAKAAGDQISDLKSAIGNGYDAVAITRISNSYPDSTGFPSYNGWDRTDYISVSAGVPVYIDNTNLSNDNAWYDSNKTFLSMFTIGIGNKMEIIPPTNAAYMVISNNTTKFFGGVYNGTLAHWNTDDTQRLENSIELLNNAVYNDIVYDDVAITWTLGRVMSSGGVLVESASTTFEKSGFILLHDNVNVTVAPGYKVFIWQSAYDELGHTASDITSGWTEGNIQITYNPYYPYIIICMQKNGSTLLESEGANAVKLFYTTSGNYVLKSPLPSSWSSKVRMLQKTQGKQFAFAIQTDTHFGMVTHKTGTVTFAANDETYCKYLKDLTKSVGFDFIANLGDVIRGYQFDTYNEMEDALTEAIKRYVDGVCCPVMVSVGNHDDACMWTEVSGEGSGNKSLDEVILPAEQYAKIFMPTSNTCFGNYKTNGKSLYYYVDYADVRVINLNTRDLAYNAVVSSDVSVNHNAISDAQVNWLTNIALDTDKQVLVLCHVPLIESLASTDLPDNAGNVINALKAFETGGGRVIGVMCGHTHTQASATADGILHIVFANGGDFAECVFVDTENHTIVTKMVGNSTGKSDRTFSY